MHRAPGLLLVALAAALLATACGDDTDRARTGASDVLEVTAGFYPYAFVAERVGGDDVTVTNLAASGAEPHDLELSPRQVGALQETDLVLYSKGFQPAVDEAVEQSASDRALDVLEAVELREGDPHVWLDPVRLSTIAGAVADRLGELSPERAGDFERRALELSAGLKELDGELQRGLADCARTQLVTSHDAFGYLADAYGLEQVPLSGLSPEDEASPKRLAEVARYAKEQGVTTIFFEDLVSPKVAESLAREVGATATALNPLEGPPDVGDYLTEMRANLEVLRTALDCG